MSLDGHANEEVEEAEEEEEEEEEEGQKESQRTTLKKGNSRRLKQEKVALELQSHPMFQRRKTYLPGSRK